ncbi:capsule biosynthesis protein [Paracoccus albicereus]
MRTEPTDDGFGDRQFPGASTQPPAGHEPRAGAGTQGSAAAAATPADDGLAAKLASIKAENLTARQLRIAARIAKLNQIEFGSEHEAVLRLRERGIDPSHRAAVGQILSTEGARAQSAPTPNAPAVIARQTLPQPLKDAPVPAPPPGQRPLPSREELTEERRAADILRIQRDIAARRRKRMAMLILRLAFFVALPTVLMGWYYYNVATPLYATNSQFQIQQADSGGGGGMGSLLSGSPLSTNTDAVAVQSYLSSREAMLRLDEDMGFKQTFQDPTIDPVRRLAPDATNEAAYSLYQTMVKIGYDPTEGMINMEVIAPDPQQSKAFSTALIGYAEGQIDQLTARLRTDQMAGAEAQYSDAEAKVLEAQRRVQELQQELGVLDPVAESSAVMAQISQLETQANAKRLELSQLLANPRPQQSRVAAVEGEIAQLEQMIVETRGQLTEGNETRASLASISGELRIAESDLLTRQELLAAAATQMETARIEANKQVRYLSLSVAPVPPDEPTYPKAMQNTLVSFLIFSGIYLMMSLTASILREQVSS